MENLWLLWLAVAVVALVIEFMTTALVSVWVCAGALVAMILALCGADILVQIIAMAVVTVITFIICMICYPIIQLFCFFYIASFNIIKCKP